MYIFLVTRTIIRWRAALGNHGGLHGNALGQKCTPGWQNLFWWPEIYFWWPEIFAGPQKCTSG